ncbi:uncharacterized protein LOC144561479 isoform X2 [Carex rostrata]
MAPPPPAPTRPPPNYIPNPNPYQNIYLSGPFQNIQICGQVGAPPPATATSGPPPAALSRSSFPSNGAPVGPPNGHPSMIQAPLAQSFRGRTHGSPPPNQSFNAPPGRPTSASYFANQNLNPVSEPLQTVPFGAHAWQTQQRRGGTSGVIPRVSRGQLRISARGGQESDSNNLSGFPLANRGGTSGVIPRVRMGPAAMGQHPMTPPHAGAQVGTPSKIDLNQIPRPVRSSSSQAYFETHQGTVVNPAPQHYAIRHSNRPRGGSGGVPSIRNPVVEPPKKTLPDLLKEHTLPPGLFPKDITDFQFDEKTRKIAVTMPDVNWELICDSCVLRFSKTVTGLLEGGKLSDINGMKTQTGMTYGKISCIEIRQQSEQRKGLLFTTDQLSLTKRFLEFKDVKNGRRF